MPQVAQQDYLRIEVADVTQLSADEKKQINDAAERGVLLDALVVAESGDESRVIAVNKDEKRAAIYSLTEEGVVTINWRA